MTIKLTKAQEDLLNNCDVMPQNVVSYYTPAKSLVRKGLCEWKSNGYREQLAITPAGKQHLEEIKKL